MNWKKATQIFILATCVVWIIYDLIAVTKGATISAAMQLWAFQCPLAPCVWGGLAGHFFVDSPFKMRPWRAIVLGVLILGVSGAGLALIPHGSPWTVVFHPLLVFAVFVPVGIIFFPQKKDQ